MDVNPEAVSCLESRRVPVETETEAVEEDVFPEEAAPCSVSPLHAESLDFPDTPTLCSPKEMLERRVALLKGLLEAEEVYLRELEALLMPMKALRASAGTSQPVLSSQQVQAVFYQVPEIRDMHQSFYSGFDLMSSFGCDPEFLCSSEGNSQGPKDAKCHITLLYKPLDRVTKTTLVLHDLLKTTPEEHGDYASLQEALRLSRSFLSGSRRGERRQLMRDGFVVDAAEGERHLRHLFLYTDLLLCTRNKQCTCTSRKQDQYRFCWYLPLAGLKLRWVADQELSPDARLRLHGIRTKIAAARSRKKLEQMELMLLTHSPVHKLELHSPSGKSHTLLLSSLYELEEWRELIEKLTKDSEFTSVHQSWRPGVKLPSGLKTLHYCGPKHLPPRSHAHHFCVRYGPFNSKRIHIFSVCCLSDIETVPPDLLTLTKGVLVPHVVRCCVEEVERRGMDEVGLYRVSGDSSDVGALKNEFNSSKKKLPMRSADVNVVSGVLKLFFRELPEPLVPTEMFQSLDMDLRLVSMLSVLESCPPPNRHTFLYLLHHLRRVSDKQDVNRMSLMNLATVFGPSLLRTPVVEHGLLGPSMDISQELVVQVQVVFSYLQCNNLPEAWTSLPHDTDDEETTHL
uniref:Si:dkey-33c9.6 n=1 Tax=Gasterosteus aculeatus aculeatus TaxID=481459 RepID=A0AAQ4PGT3_GASAC